MTEDHYDICHIIIMTYVKSSGPRTKQFLFGTLSLHFTEPPECVLNRICTLQNVFSGVHLRAAHTLTPLHST